MRYSYNTLVYEGEEIPKIKEYYPKSFKNEIEKSLKVSNVVESVKGFEKYENNNGETVLVVHKKFAIRFDHEGQLNRAKEEVKDGILEYFGELEPNDVLIWRKEPKLISDGEGELLLVTRLSVATNVKKFTDLDYAT